MAWRSAGAESPTRFPTSTNIECDPSFFSNRPDAVNGREHVHQGAAAEPVGQHGRPPAGLRPFGGAPVSLDRWALEVQEGEHDEQ